jgi:hypothetical protein
MNIKIITLVLIFMAMPLIASAQIASGGTFSMEKSSVATGGGTSTSGAFTVTGTTGQTAAGTAYYGAFVAHRAGFWVPDQLEPSAAEVSLSGRVTSAGGAGIRNVIVTLTDSSGTSRQVATGSFGLYLFTNVEVGQTYTLTVAAKRYNFTNPTRIVTVSDELTDLDFTASGN